MPFNRTVRASRFVRAEAGSTTSRRPDGGRGMKLSRLGILMRGRVLALITCFSPTMPLMKSRLGGERVYLVVAQGAGLVEGHDAIHAIPYGSGVRPPMVRKASRWQGCLATDQRGRDVPFRVGAVAADASRGENFPAFDGAKRVAGKVTTGRSKQQPPRFGASN